jgi:hypothetical protein
MNVEAPQWAGCIRKPVTPEEAIPDELRDVLIHAKGCDGNGELKPRGSLRSPDAGAPFSKQVSQLHKG